MGKNSCPLSMSSNPHHPRRKPGMVMCICNPSIERQRQTDPKKTHDQPRQNKLQDTVTRQKRKEKKKQRARVRHVISCVCRDTDAYILHGIHMFTHVHTTCAHAHTHTCTWTHGHTHTNPMFTSSPVLLPGPWQSLIPTLPWQLLLHSSIWTKPSSTRCFHVGTRKVRDLS